MSLFKMLPREILTLVLLASSAYAYPRFGKSAAGNGTATITKLPPTTAAPGWIHAESTADGFESSSTNTVITCVSTCEPMVIVVQPPASGFDDTTTEQPTDATRPLIASLPPSSSSPNIIITSTPTVIGIHTDVAPTATSAQPGNGPGSPGATAIAPTSQYPSGNDLLTDIISHIANPGSQPSKPAPATSAPGDNTQSAPGNAGPQQMQQGTTGSNPGLTALPGAQPTVSLGDLITLGPATLTLTPGLSTTVGSGSAATYIAITTNSAGQTMITISSSGTAVTATVTNAPATVTALNSGFDASITSEARPGTTGSSTGSSSGSPHGAASASASKGGALDGNGHLDWWISGVIGILGLGVVI